MGSGYRDERDAAHARADALERENRELRSRLAGAPAAPRSRWSVLRWVVLGVIGVLVVGSVATVFVARGQVAPPDIDSPPGVTGAVRLDVSPLPAEVTVDQGAPQHLDHFLSVTGLDPNFVHHVRVTAPGFQSEERDVVVPANGTRNLEIELRPLAAH